MLPKFKNPQLLETALTHRSALNEPSSGTSSKESNERLEFLGDAVLELAVTLFLFNELPQDPEGKLTAYRSALVRTTTLAKVGRKLNLGQKLYLSKGEEATGGRNNDSLLADTMEAIIGALYLDQGLAAAQKFIQEHVIPEFEQIKQNKLYKDAKSLLQETVQAEGYATPTYRLLKAEGPDHDKTFTVEGEIGEQVLGRGIGSNKQTAEQAAARQALKRFED
jgi:ribonuclease-3